VELDEGVTVETTVVVATEEELEDGEGDELDEGLGDGLDEEGTGAGVKIEDELGEGAAVDVTTWVVVETGVGLEDEDGTGTGVNMEDELGEGVTTETTVVVATDGLGAGDELGLAMDVTT
jgi:hypothetical protein